MNAGANRFVDTNAIRAAVIGRELEVLDALGLRWRDGRPHITCPYSHHGGSNDWRWDEKKRRAFCTCIEKSHSIFDVVATVSNCNFATAKIRVAELLNRTDLIREKAGAHQPTDAASLLNPPAERRDDRLPIAYIAHRLGVTEDEIPLPITSMVGLKSLAYFDPPAPGSKAKPKLVGQHPCAVFGTVAADGRAHAHRIYLATDGRGKADLGIGPDGQARDPKKSARKIADDDNTMGRSVLWGDPAIAPHIVVTEGIETGSAVAFALQAETLAGEIAVASAITAGGVEAFQIYPATKRVTIAADRDEGEKEGKPRSRRGERAGRTFGINNFQKIEVRIALPGKPGESVDWLDVLLRDRIEALRAGVLAAVTFIPTQAELEDLAKRQRRAAHLEEIARQYPLPAMDTLTLRYAHTATGRVTIHKVINSKDEEVMIPIMSPLSIPARLRFIDQGGEYGLRCLLQDMGGQPRTVDFDRGALPRMAASDIRSRLFAAGLRTQADGEVIAVQILKAADPEREIISVRRAGWHEVAGCPDPIFITPTNTLIGAPAGLDVELTSTARIGSDIARRGTLAGWRAAITRTVSVTGCPHWKIGAAAGFVGPIIDLTRLDPCGLNFSGLTSTGKSLAQRIAVSSWSSPDIRRRGGLHQSASATENYLEDMGDRSNGTILSLDELALVAGKVVARSIYTLAEGVGKGRMAPDANRRDRYCWQTFIILSCECSLEEKVRSDGGQWLAGMAVRIIDIHVTDVDRNVDPMTLRVIDGIERHYGYSGPAFVRSRIASGVHRQPGELRERIQRAAGELAGQGSDGARRRAAIPLAVVLVSGELAKSFDLLPADTPIREAVQWAWNRYLRSPDAAALNPEKQVIESLQTWISERWGVTIKPVDAPSELNNREAIGWYDEKAVYIPKGRLREAVGNILKESQIGAILSDLGCLAEKPKQDRYTVEWIPSIGRTPAYALSRSMFGRPDRKRNRAFHRVGKDD
jgi:hypothetical protein